MSKRVLPTSNPVPSGQRPRLHVLLLLLLLLLLFNFLLRDPVFELLRLPRPHGINALSTKSRRRPTQFDSELRVAGSHFCIQPSRVHDTVCSALLNSDSGLSSMSNIYWFVTAIHLTGRPRFSPVCAVRENGFLKFLRSGRIHWKLRRHVFNKCSTSYYCSSPSILHLDYNK